MSIDIIPVKTEVMRERELAVNATWVDEGDGYWSATGMSIGPVAYIALPANHPDVGRHYDEVGDYDSDDWGPDVNGGLTFGEDNVFGWDYSHAYNRYEYAQDILAALDYFRKRASS